MIGHLKYEGKNETVEQKAAKKNALMVYASLEAQQKAEFLRRFQANKKDPS